MKAIINIQNKRNQYSKLNNLTFEVGDLMSQSLSLIGVDPEFPNNHTDFSFKEIIIVDIEKEMQSAREIADWYGGFSRLDRYYNLINYCESKGLANNTYYVPVP